MNTCITQQLLVLEHVQPSNAGICTGWWLSVLQELCLHKCMFAAGDLSVNQAQPTKQTAAFTHNSCPSTALTQACDTEA